MSFLAPALLAGLVALAVPIYLHLVQRERRRAVVFPSLMFLRKIPYHAVRRHKVEHWVLLMLRCAALVLLVLAFARPFLQGASFAAGPISSAREVVILLDRSYSMGYGDHWERARAAARRVVEALGPDDQATLVVFTASAEAGPQSTRDRGSLLAAIAATRVGLGSTRYGSALRLAQGILETSALPRREVVLISDFQKIAWDPGDVIRLPDEAVFTPVAIVDPEPANVAVASVTFDREPFSGRERVVVSARLMNRGVEAVQDRSVVLEIDGRAIETRRVSLDPQSVGTVTFAPFVLAEAFTRGTVRLAADALPQDDVFLFVLSPGESVPVLIIESSRTPADSSLYLRRALGVGRSPAFQVQVFPVERVTPAELANRAVVVLNNARPPTGTAGQALASFVSNGGGLLVVLGERSAWPATGLDLLPAPFGPPTDRSGGPGGTLGFVDYSHPVFEVFSAPRSGDLAAARFFRYRPVDVTARTDSVLARFDDGAIALAERRVERGRVLLWASSLDAFWNDLAIKPVFVPFVHQLVRHLSGYVPPAPWLTVGEVLRVARRQPALGAAAGGAPADSARVVLTPDGRRVTLEVGTAHALALAEQGFYQVRTPGVEELRPEAVAVNLDVRESDLAALDPEELAAAVARRSGDDTARASAPAPSPEDEEQRQALWRYLLAGTFLLLGAETVASNRVSRAAR